MKALIFEGKVVDFSENEFPVHSDFTWVEATSDAEYGGTWDGSKFGPYDTRTDEQKTADAWTELRRVRNHRLNITDWMALSDVTMSDEWKKYRQDLRDLPANTSDPTKPTYPTEPN